MPRTAIPVTVIDRTGVDLSTITPTPLDVPNGNSIINTGNMWIEIKNTNAASTARTVTIALSGSYDGQSVTPKTQSIAAGKTWIKGPWPPGIYGGQLLINGDHLELTVMAFKLTDA